MKGLVQPLFSKMLALHLYFIWEKHIIFHIFLLLKDLVYEVDVKKRRNDPDASWE